MAALQSAEQKIGGLFKDAPQMSKSAKESLANAFPWIALVFGILQLIVAWGLWGSVRLVENVSDYANSLSVAFGGAEVGLSSMDKTIIYLGLATLVLDGVLLLMAFPQLKARARRGWDLLFIGALINVAYSVIALFMARNGGVGSFLLGLISSAIGFYLLFQVRELYHKA